jgi:hypothetical protein
VENLQTYKKKQLSDLGPILRNLIRSKPADLELVKIVDLVKDAIKVGEDHFRGQTNFDESHVIDDLETILKRIPLDNSKQLTSQEIGELETQLIHLANDILPSYQQVATIPELMAVKAQKVDVGNHQKDQIRQIQSIVKLLKGEDGKIDNENLGKELNVMLTDAKDDGDGLDEFNHIQDNIGKLGNILFQIPEGGRGNLNDRKKELMKEELENMEKDIDDPELKAKLQQAEKALGNNDLKLFSNLMGSLKGDMIAKSREISRVAEDKNADKYYAMAQRLKSIGEILRDSLERRETLPEAIGRGIQNELVGFWNDILGDCCDDPRVRNAEPDEVKVTGLPVGPEEKH